MKKPYKNGFFGSYGLAASVMFILLNKSVAVTRYVCHYCYLPAVESSFTPET